jgi:hypothetical protein
MEAQAAQLVGGGALGDRLGRAGGQDRNIVAQIG